MSDGFSGAWPAHPSPRTPRFGLVSLAAAAVLAVAGGWFPGPAAGDEPLPQVAAGFELDLLHRVDPKQEGSWVSLAVDPQGRLTASDQYGRLYRIDVTTQPPQVKQLAVDIGFAQGLLYAFDSLYVMVNDQPERSGLHRLRDTDGDDEFDEVTHILPLDGSGEHGPHAIVPDPDGKSLYICCGNHTNLPPLTGSRLPTCWQEDQLLPRLWDPNGHAVGRMAPGGFICKVAPDGSRCELIAAGFRNEYDIAFQPDGELFTYDADMEWDIGLPWYRPTRILHVTSGGEFGWRSGSGKWPEDYPDSLPAVVDVGPGSPTGLTFGYGARFPADYQRALFAADWSYGRLYAVHLRAEGSTFRGKLEMFASGQPFPITDLVIRPQDGALYLITGGRRVQSHLYRIRYVGSESTAPVQPRTRLADQRNARRALEDWHHDGAPSTAIEAARAQLESPDRFLRYAARLVLEHQPPATWLPAAHRVASCEARCEMVMAMARQQAVATPADALRLLESLDGRELSPQQWVAVLRSCGLVFLRLGAPDDEVRTAVLARIQPFYPAQDERVNRELCRLLAYLHAPDLVPKTLALLRAASSQEDQLHDLFCLRVPGLTWTLGERKEALTGFAKILASHGGRSYEGAVSQILDDFEATLSESEQRDLKEELQRARQPAADEPSVSRTTVRHWTVDEALQGVEQNSAPPNLERGRQLFVTAQCVKCHRFRGSGGMLGPDLTSASGRFGLRDLLTSIIEPAENISDQYRLTNFELQSGRVLSGRVVNLDQDTYRVAVDMYRPDRLVTVRVDEIAHQQPSTTSAMPTGLLDILTMDEIADLVAYLRNRD